MDSIKHTRYFQPIEMSNEDRLETAALMEHLKEENIIPLGLNLGQFVNECFIRGRNEYMKDLYRRD
jgi:hypothetical protein